MICRSGLSTRVLGDEVVAEAANTPSSVGPPMSVRIALGASHETHGSRKNVVGDSRRCLIADMIFCWRRARERSFSRLLHRFLRVRASASACLPFRWWVPDLRRSVVPPFLAPPL